MANVQISMPVEHADELLGLSTPSILPAINAPAGPPPTPNMAYSGPLPAAAQPAPVLPVVQTPNDQNIDKAESSIGQDVGSRRPWGQLGVGGKIGRVLADIGGAVLPKEAAFIPGTLENQAWKAERDTNLLSNLQKSGLMGQQAQTQMATQRYLGQNAALAGARAHLTGTQAQMYQDALNDLSNPAIHQAFSTLSNPQSSETDRRNAMATISQSPISMLPMLRGEMSGAENLYRQGEQDSRVRGHNVIPDPCSPTGYSTVQYDAMGNAIGMLPVEPSSESQILLGPQARPLIGAEATIAGARAGATQAQQLVPVIDPKTNDVIGYAPKGSVAGATGAGQSGIQQALVGGMTPAPGTTVREQGQNAQSLANMIQNNIYPAIDEAARAGEIGPTSGRVQQFLLKTVGNPGSPAAKLQATLDAVPMMLGRMYGYRSAEYAQHMSQFLSTRMTPQALHAYLDGVISHASVIQQQGGMGPKGGASSAAPPPPKVGAVENGYRFKGGDPGNSSNWVKVQ